MGYDLTKGLFIREVGKLVLEPDDNVVAEITGGDDPFRVLIGAKHPLRMFLFEQTDQPKPLFGLEKFMLCFKERIFQVPPLQDLSDFERQLVGELIRGFVAGPTYTITLDLDPPEPLKKFKVIEGDGNGSPEAEFKQLFTEVPKKT